MQSSGRRKSFPFVGNRRSRQPLGGRLQGRRGRDGQGKGAVRRGMSADLQSKPGACRWTSIWTVTLRRAGGGSVPYAMKHLLGRSNSFFHGPEGTTQTPIAVVYHAVEIKFVLDEVNVPDPPPLSVEDNQNFASGRLKAQFWFSSQPPHRQPC